MKATGLHFRKARVFIEGYTTYAAIGETWVYENWVVTNQGEDGWAVYPRERVTGVDTLIPREDEDE